MLVYGIPTCGTVKKARAWLDARGVANTLVDIRATPPARERVAAWAAVFGVAAMRNLSGGSYRALGPEKEGWNNQEWIDAFAADPMLLKRPIVERDGAPLMVGFNGSDAEIAERLGLR